MSHILTIKGQKNADYKFSEHLDIVYDISSSYLWFLSVFYAR